MEQSYNNVLMLFLNVYPKGKIQLEPCTKIHSDYLAYLFYMSTANFQNIKQLIFKMHHK